MGLEVKLASTDAEIDVCEEIIRQGFGRVMRLGVEPEVCERRSLKTLFCHDDETGRILATSRLVPIDYIEGSKALMDVYGVAGIPPELRRRTVLSFQSAALPEHRGGEVMARLFLGCVQYALDGRYLFMVSACKPYVFPHFMRMGFRPFGRAYVSAEGGYRIPILLVLHDSDHLNACKSPFVKILPRAPDDPELLAGKAWFDENCPAEKNLNVRVITDPKQIDFDLRFFQGMSNETTSAIFRYAVEIACSRGDEVIKENAPEHVIGFVLTGSVDVFKRKKKLATLTAGEIFGEVSFLLKIPRTASLVAASEGTRIAFVSVIAIDAIKDPAEAALFWRRVSSHLAERLQKLTELL